MNKFWWVAFLFLYMSAYCQNSVKIVVNDLAEKKAEKIFIAGAFNNWKPGNATYALKKIDSNKWEILLKDVPKGTFNYKFTQGTWETEEVTAAGETIGNHTLEIEKDYAIGLSIYGWKNNAAQAKKHTASKNVYLLTDSFYIPNLHVLEKYPFIYPQIITLQKIAIPFCICMMGKIYLMNLLLLLENGE